MIIEGAFPMLTLSLESNDREPGTIFRLLI